MKKIRLLFIGLILSQFMYSQKFEELALTPPMGWNSWNKFGCDVSEELIMDMADAMVSSGMKAAGYEYIVIDDCWQIDRDEKGNIIADPERFPSGMEALADYIHSKGLKFGLYTCAGVKTCMKRPGSRGYEFQDARTYASWGVDYVKSDWCSHGKQNAEASYTTMRDAIYKAGRPIVLSICEWGSSKPWEWGKNVGHLWRTSGDILNCFDCKVSWGGSGVLKLIDAQVGKRGFAGPGHWNDADIMQIGNGVLTPNENRVHFSMWCMLASPIMAGNDLRAMDNETKEILTNKEVIAVNQDSLGIPGLRWMDYGDFEIWFKPMKNGDIIICFLNRDDQQFSLDYDLTDKEIVDNNFGWKKYEIDGHYKIRDLWKHEDIGTTDEPVVDTIPGHDVLLLRLSKNNK